MKVDVVFQERSFSTRVEVIGPGTVYLDETGIIVEGDIPRFSVPMMARILRQIICSTGTRTIPFSRIVSYSPPAGLRSSHSIVYLLPDRTKRALKFKMRRRPRTSSEEFAARFHEYHASALSFTDGGGS